MATTRRGAGAHAIRVHCTAAPWPSQDSGDPKLVEHMEDEERHFVHHKRHVHHFHTLHILGSAEETADFTHVPETTQRILSGSQVCPLCTGGGSAEK